MSIKRLKFFQEMLHKLLLYLGKIRFALDYLLPTTMGGTRITVISVQLLQWERCQKNGKELRNKEENLRILTNSESKILKFYILDSIT